MSLPRGSSMPVHHVKCLDCGREVVRATYWREPCCDACRHKRSKNQARGKFLRMSRQARQFRIICHVLGWEPEAFAEMIEEMRKSPMCFRKQPETRAAKYDLHTEKRAAR